MCVVTALHVIKKFWMLFFDLLFWKQQPSWRIMDILIWLEPTEDSDLILLVMDHHGISASQTSWLNWNKLTLRCRRKRQRQSRFCSPPDKTTPCFLHTLDTNKQNTNKKKTSTCNLWGRGERLRKVPRTGSLGPVLCSRASQRLKLLHNFSNNCSSWLLFGSEL